MEEHLEDDLHRKRAHLETFGYQFHITSQRWLLKLHGNPLAVEELYHDDGGMSPQDHIRQAQENMRSAMKAAEWHLDERRKAHHDQMLKKHG